ncbi:PDZ domain-containing protein [Planifilum fulgidum]|jgi:PDZ domain-containing protein|uniref:endopeptidase La n=1 Tax=Planifilum fulgidum TaxID=201973 RepID=A0A1I2R472_9BACL|nr:SepM family pheromone-processing serine protease [Planifilum fulgidum]SFG35494.1 PDZ domain-containing protein [Planifilum fulgidum]
MNRRRWGILGLAVLLIVTAAWFIPAPYFVLRPGTAVPVLQLVDVAGGNFREKGRFLLTTVSVSEASALQCLFAWMIPGSSLVPREKLLEPGESPDAYRLRQREWMLLSQQNAIIAAFRHAGRPVEEILLGVKVLRTLSGMPAEGVLASGDRIVALDGRPIRTVPQLLRALKGRREGEAIRITLWRKGRKLERTLSLVRFSRAEGGQVGIGIVPVTERRVQTKPAVRIRADHIGGPSAGLMFALEILNQLTPEDLTRGLKIAGTGTLSAEGEVGQIGGVEQKVMAAEREGADLFFVPADVRPGDSNQSRAEAVVRKIGSRMKIVPVHSLEEAVGYLKRLGKERAEAPNIDTPANLAYNNPVLMARAGAL